MTRAGEEQGEIGLEFESPEAVIGLEIGLQKSPFLCAKGSTQASCTGASLGQQFLNREALAFPEPGDQLSDDFDLFVRLEIYGDGPVDNQLPTVRRKVDRLLDIRSMGTVQARGEDARMNNQPRCEVDHVAYANQQMTGDRLIWKAMRWGAGQNHPQP